jgi:hypothetical protein
MEARQAEQGKTQQYQQLILRVLGFDAQPNLRLAANH